jgi:hypothetical protein
MGHPLDAEKLAASGEIPSLDWDKSVKSHSALTLIRAERTLPARYGHLVA